MCFLMREQPRRRCARVKLEDDARDPFPRVSISFAGKYKRPVVVAMLLSREREGTKKSAGKPPGRRHRWHNWARHLQEMQLRRRATKLLGNESTCTIGLLFSSPFCPLGRPVLGPFHFSFLSSEILSDVTSLFAPLSSRAKFPSTSFLQSREACAVINFFSYFFLIREGVLTCL